MHRPYIHSGTITGKGKANNKDVHIAFVGLRKAYDLLLRTKLWNKIRTTEKINRSHKKICTKKITSEYLYTLGFGNDQVLIAKDLKDFIDTMRKLQEEHTMAGPKINRIPINNRRGDRRSIY